MASSMVCEKALVAVTVGGDDVDAVVELQVEQVVEAGDRIGDRTVAGRIQGTCPGKDLHVPVDADHAETVVAHRADGPRDVGAMAVVVHRVRGAVEEVDADDVVDAAVAVVIDAVARRTSAGLTQTLGPVTIPPA